MRTPDDDSEPGFTPQGEIGPKGYYDGINDPVESVAGAPANAGRTANDSDQGMRLYVTPHAQITNLEGWKFLACGVDSLDLSVYVQWSDDWDTQSAELEDGKTKAAGTQGILINDGQCLILPGGKRPSFRWHLQWADFHLFLGCSQSPQKDTPNVYASINSETLWRNGVAGAVALVIQEIESLGGQVLKIKASRCDLAADFHIPGGVPHDLLLALRVPSDGKHSHHMKGGRQETFYQGAKTSPVQMRIYDKGLEVEKGGLKFWFLKIWGVPTCDSVWRVEFQVRRPCLKAFGMSSISELQQNLAGLWKYLTEDWFSLRMHDDSNVTRRTVHPWWLGVQCCDAQFGVLQPLLRTEKQEPANAEFFVSHGAGCLLSYAARKRLSTIDLASAEYAREMKAYWARKSFTEAYVIKSIELGFVENGVGPSTAGHELGEVA